MADKLTQVQLYHFREAFTKYEEAYGVIPSKALKSVMEVLGYDLSYLQIKQMVESIGGDIEGTIEYNSYLELMARINKATISHDQIMNAWQIFEKNGNGCITAAELRHTLTKLGEGKISTEEIDEMVREADVDGDGTINIQEFSKMLTRL